MGKHSQCEQTACLACNANHLKTFQFDEGLIYRCPDCKLEWADKTDIITLKKEDFTGVHKHYMDPESFNSERYPPYQDFFQCLENRFGGKTLRILDVGCGNGLFINECLRRNHKVRGIEINKSMKSTMSAEVVGLITFTPIEEYQNFDDVFDVITFWDSFEHFPKAFTILNQLKNALVQGGVVFIRVNNSHDVFNIITRIFLITIPKLGYPLLRACFNLSQHSWNFSVGSMTKLMNKNNWQVERCRITETPVFRLTTSFIMQIVIKMAYLFNRIIGGGKIGEYWVSPENDGFHQPHKTRK